MSAPDRRVWGSTRVAFLKVKEAVKTRLEGGEPMTAIHRDLRLPMSYTQFTYHVTRYLPELRRKAEQPPSLPPPPIVQAPPHQAGAGPEAEPRRAPIKRFQPLTRTDPAAVKREDLI